MLQRNICFFSSQGTSMQKDKGSPRPWKEAIAVQPIGWDLSYRLRPLLLVSSQQETVYTFAQEGATSELMLAWHTVSILWCCSFVLQHTSGLYCKNCQPKVYSRPLTHIGQDVLGVLWKHLLNWALVSIIQVLFLLCIPEWFSVWYQDFWTE